MFQKPETESKHALWGWVSSTLVLLTVLIGCFSVISLRFQTDIFSLFPQELKELQDLREVQKSHSISQNAFIVLDPACGWNEEMKQRFWEELQKQTLPCRGVDHVIRGFDSKQEMARFIALRLSALPSNEFTEMVEGLQKRITSKDPVLLTGAIDAEEIMRARMDPLRLMKYLGEDILNQKPIAIPPVLQIIPKFKGQDFDDCQTLEKELELAVEKTLQGLGRLQDQTYVYLTGDPIFTAQISKSMKSDILVMLGFTLTLILAVFWFTYRSLKPLLWIAIAQLTVVASAMIAARYGIGELNVISMGFASILLGVSVDYCILVYHHFAAGEAWGNARWKSLTKGIWFSSVTTAMAFGVLYLSSFPGLQQMAVLVAVGLISSAAFATTWLAWILNRYRPDACPMNHHIPEAWGMFLKKRKYWILGITAVLGGIAMIIAADRGLNNIYNSDIKSLQPNHLRAYKGHEVLKSTLPAAPVELQPIQSNQTLWPKGLAKGVELFFGDEKNPVKATWLQVARELEGWSSGTIRLSGKTPGASEWEALKVALDRVAVKDFKSLSLVMIGLTVLLCYGAHRSFRLVVANFGGLLITLALLYLLLVLFDISLTLVSLLCIPLLIGVTLDYSMHMLMGLEHEKGDVVAALKHLLIPIGLTGLASVIGFTAPAISNQPALINFGLVMDAGILCAIVVGLVVLPTAHHMMYRSGDNTPSSLNQALAFAMGAWIVKRLPRTVYWPLAYHIGRFYAALSPGKVKKIRKNLSVLSKKEVSISEAAKVYGQFGGALADYFYLGTRDRSSVMKLLTERHGYEHLVEMHKKGRGGLILTSHFSLFELGGVLLTELNFPAIVLSIPETSQELTDWRMSFRRRWGVDTVEVRKDPFSILPIYHALRNNTFVIALIDRPYSSQNVSVNFPNGKVDFAAGVLQVAQMAESPVTVATIVQKKDRTYVARVHPSFQIESGKNREETLNFYSQKIADLLIPTLQENKTQWFQFNDMSVKK